MLPDGNTDIELPDLRVYRAENQSAAEAIAAL
jgi:hypothetical protein